MSGKAIIINGLVVSEPLMTVTFKDADSILSSYLAKNTTISSSEKDSLKTFVAGLLEAGLWEKMKYFYPMLGGTVADQLVEVVSPDMEDLFNTNLSGTLDITGLSIVDRKLRSLNRNKSNPYPVVDTRRIKSLDFSNMGMVFAMNMAGNTAATTPMGDSLSLMYRLYNYNAVGIVGATGVSNYRYPEMYASGHNASVVYPTGSSDGGNNLSYAERIIYADYNGSVATLYKEKVQYKTGTNSAVSDPENGYRISGLLNNYTGNNSDNGFLAITEHLTQAEWGTFYDLLLPFLQAVGKHS